MSNKIRPLTPSEVESKFLEQIPDQVIEAVNELLLMKSGGSSSYISIPQEELVLLIVEKMGIDKNLIYERRWLNFEPLFEMAGWSVEHDSPGYNESYKASFKFRKNLTR